MTDRCTGDTERYQVVEAGTGGTKMGTFDSKVEAREYVEERFGQSPSPTSGRVIWKGEKRIGRSRYILKLRTVHADTDRSESD